MSYEPEHEIYWKRLQQYEAVSPIETTFEVSREDYLRRLSVIERNNLSSLLYQFAKRMFRGTNGIMALAVGTTTYDEEYWAGLESYLKEKDPSKLDLVSKRGEDIDIRLFPDMHNSISFDSYKKWVEYLEADLNDLDIAWSHEDGERENGTSYLPEINEFHEFTGGVHRHKQIQYGEDSYQLIFPNESRNIHLSLSKELAELQIKDERVGDHPFSLLFRHSQKWELIELINKINSDE